MRLPVKLPELAEGVEKAELVTIRVHVGEVVEKGQVLFDVETEKASVPIPSPSAGSVAEIHVREGDVIRIGDLLVTLETEKGEGEPVKSPPAPEKVERRIEEPGKVVAASPAVRRLAREHGISLEEIHGTGPEGRITEDDLKRRLQGTPVKESVHRPEMPEPVLEREEPALPDFSRWGPIRRVSLSALRRTIGENVTRAWLTIPHVHQFHEADITDLEGLLHRYQERFEQEGVHLTLTPFILSAVVRTLKTFPHFNATLDPGKGELILKEYCHLGVAVDTEGGLIVPVLRDLSGKRIGEIARLLQDLAQRTRERKVSLEELQGGTFTVSNLGGIGGSGFTPIIRSPETAVLGIGRTADRAVVREKTVTKRRYLPLCLGYDHRVIDGAEGARFLDFLVKILEDYEGFLLGL